MLRSRDPGDVFVLDAAEALAAPGVRHHRVLAGRLPGIALSSAHVPDAAEVQIELTLEAQGASVIVEGAAWTHWEGECRRCLGPTTGRLEVPFREVYLPPDPDPSLPPGSDRTLMSDVEPTDHETFHLEDGDLDLRPMLHDALALQLPLAPLCAEDCGGPAPDTHPVGRPDDMAGKDDPSSDAKRDPRWAVLDRIRFD